MQTEKKFDIEEEEESKSNGSWLSDLSPMKIVHRVQNRISFNISIFWMVKSVACLFLFYKKTIDKEHLHVVFIFQNGERR
jgi:hypothetical protein